MRPHAGVKSLAILLLMLSPFCGYERAAAAAQGASSNDFQPAGTTSLLTRPTASSESSTNLGTVRLALQPGKAPISRGLFGMNTETNENGQAFLFLPGGTAYEGEVRDGKPEGEGTITAPNGTHQWGEFRNGLSYKLTGTWIAPDGTREEGIWNVDGTQSGGTITWKDGRVYKGDWKLMNGVPELPNGNGTMTWPDGRVYVGQFHDGKMDGRGKMTYPGGKIEEGLWKQDQFAGPIP